MELQVPRDTRPRLGCCRLSSLGRAIAPDVEGPRGWRRAAEPPITHRADSTTEGPPGLPSAAPGWGEADSEPVDLTGQLAHVCVLSNELCEALEGSVYILDLTPCASSCPVQESPAVQSRPRSCGI